MTSAADRDDGSPIVRVLPRCTVEERRRALRALVAEALGVGPDAVRIAHDVGRAPAVVVPVASNLRLSSTSRAGFAAVAVSRTPIGIDLERVDEAAEPPWRVLHPGEETDLRGMAPCERALAFARIWSGKEAYLKALGIGLAGEPRFVRVSLRPDGLATVADAASSTTLFADTLSFERDGVAYVLSLVTLDAEGARWTIVMPDQQRWLAGSRTGGHEGIA